MTFDLLKKYGITYRDADHHYSRFGVKLDSVTGCLPYLLDANEYLANNPRVIEKAGDRGHYVARKIEDIERSWDAGDGSRPLFTMPASMPLKQANNWVGCMDSYCQFKQETGFTALVVGTGAETEIASELFVYHDILDYVGRLDLCGICTHVSKDVILIDVKASAKIPDTVGMQTAAYFEAYNRNARLYGLPKAKHRGVLHLTAKSYKFETNNDPKSKFFTAGDFADFLSLLGAGRVARRNGMEIQWVPIDKSAASPRGELASPEEVFA